MTRILPSIYLPLGGFRSWLRQPYAEEVGGGEQQAGETCSRCYHHQMSTCVGPPPPGVGVLELLTQVHKDRLRIALPNSVSSPSTDQPPQKLESATNRRFLPQGAGCSVFTYNHW